MPVMEKAEKARRSHPPQPRRAETRLSPGKAACLRAPHRRAASDGDCSLLMRLERRHTQGIMPPTLRAADHRKVLEHIHLAERQR